MSGYAREKPYSDWKNEKRRLKQIEEEEAREAGAREASRIHNERLSQLWNVPERARNAFIELEDSIGNDGAEKILAFVEEMMATAP